jgi:DNA uptake protein ComE-like DNA-binding protein
MNFGTKSRWSNLTVTAFAALTIFASGCGYFQKGGSDAAAQKERDQKTREEVANAVENAKPKLEEAGRKVGEAAKTAAEDAQAAAQGVKDGWNRGGHGSVNLNTASESDLAALPGISERDARKIIANRPYGDRHELVSKGVLSEDQYQNIHDSVTAK